MTGRCRALGLLLWTLFAFTASAQGPTPPPDLPRYDLAIRFDTEKKIVRVVEQVTWINRHARAADELVFTVYPLYEVPKKDIPLLAKTVEILRQYPSAAILTEPAGKVERVRCGNQDLPFSPKNDLPTAIVVALPTPVAQGQSVTVVIDYSLELPHKQGRWGHWDDVCYLANWLPQLAYYDDTGWQPTPFIPWHQPFFHEAGLFTATVTVPKDQVVATPSQIINAVDRGDGWKELTLAPAALRDFALVSSAKFLEFTEVVCGVTVRVVALDTHAHYAKQALKIAREAIPVYNAWFGPFPYPQFTIAEAFFPWNGNECGGMIWLDHRIFQMPQLAEGYVDYLVSHEIAHQWWYNLVGTNGYAETFMDEGAATYFSHRLCNQKRGKNNDLMMYPNGFGWLPNIRRENYRYSGWYSAILRDESSPACQPIDKYRHVYDLFSGAYDRGSRVWMMLEDRLGEAAFLDFTRQLVKKYSFRILRVDQFQKEIEAYTGKSWDEFFSQWVRGKGLVDWKVKHVNITPAAGGTSDVEVTLAQTRDYDEPTVLAVRYAGADGFAFRIPVLVTGTPLKLNDPPAEIESVGEHLVRVRMRLPQEPEQIVVDPDGVLPDADPANNYWHTPIRWRVTPLYTQLDDSGLVNDYDHWTLQFGPWIYAAASREPWYARSMLAGFRVGAIRPEHFVGGTFIAYRNDFRDIVVGADGEWNHMPCPKTQVGFHVEKRIAGPIGVDGPNDATRAVVYGRYVFAFGSALYLNPMHYLETFGTYQDNAMPFVRTQPPGALRPDHATLAGLHYSLNFLTPYWDPEGGFRVDASYAGGTVDLAGDQQGTNRFEGQLTYVQTPPKCLGPLAETRLAARVAGAAGFPNNGLYYALGGSTLFRGYDLAQRQGNAFWVFNLEWRIPIVRNVEWDCYDHLVGIRTIYAAAFTDIGAMYADGHQVGQVAYCVGGGLRCDLAAFSFIERFIFRVDVAKTLNDNSPVQLWVGIMHAF